VDEGFQRFSLSSVTHLLLTIQSIISLTRVL
jgi:hypothetical protein